MIADRYEDFMYGLIDGMMKDIGPRPACGDKERELGGLFAREIEPACERVDRETFTCSPTAFMGFFPYLVLMYVAGVVLYFFIPPVSLALAFAGGAALFLEVVRYKEFIDPVYPRREGENVAGVVRPSGEVKRRLIVSAHFDSAYEFNIWLWFKNLSAPIMGLGFLAVLLLFAFSLARTIAEPTGTPQATAFWALGIILAALSPAIIPFFFFHSGEFVPGAMDDMAGVAVVAGLGKYLADAAGGGEFFPENTEVLLLGMSSEEAGLRGAKRYAARHAGEAEDIPASAIFLDGIYDEGFFTVFKKEVWPGGEDGPGTGGPGNGGGGTKRLRYQSRGPASRGYGRQCLHPGRHPLGEHMPVGHLQAGAPLSHPVRHHRQHPPVVPLRCPADGHRYYTEHRSGLDRSSSLSSAKLPHRCPQWLQYQTGLSSLTTHPPRTTSPFSACCRSPGPGNP
ncbi:MAG: M28 family peptidase [Actinomycetota bacterium]|nr:M28 family peptidase [Actinomycetota bacterium]